MSCRIFDIKRYSINDGPGIRTTLFLKGCPLRCVWCHNPESWQEAPQILFKAGKCIGCRTCAEVCPKGLDPREASGGRASECLLCGKCVEECPACALEMCGRECTMEELMQEVEKERMVMEDSGGGVTLCGGEPLMHRSYLLELLQELGRRGFHRAIDTTLFASPETVREAVENSELLLVDLKHMDPEKHRLHTGQTNGLILDNIRMVAGMGADFFIRIPLIDGVNSDEENIDAAASFLSTLDGWKRRTVNLLPYHDIGKGKHERMQTVYNPEGLKMSTPSEATLQRCCLQFADHGIKTIIGG